MTATSPEPEAPAPSTRRGLGRTARVVVVTCVVGLLLTGVSAWAAHRADRATEQRLLDTQTQQAATVLSTAILALDQPLMAALEVQAAAGAGGAPEVFRRTFAASMRDDPLLVHASLWRRDAGAWERLGATGQPPVRAPGSAEMEDLLARAADSTTSVVARLGRGEKTRLAYAYADPDAGFAVYVERALPPDRRSSVDRNSAFSQIHYAIYLGDRIRPADLTTTDVDPADLPLEEPTSEASVPFGDTELTLVTRAREHLGSPLSEQLPWLLLVGGVVMTAAIALVARQLVDARTRVEADAATISVLYERINGLYESQRALFLRLQRALLPQVNPDIAGFEIASEYVAGTEGIEIGGDWYSVIARGDQFGFVVGDVSGRGTDAVAMMAQARFTLRAYLLDGKSPEEALEKCSEQFDIMVDERMVTVVVGVGTPRTGEIVFANAGHPLPLLLTADGASFVPMPVGPPLGVGTSTYRSTTFTMPPGSTLVAYTDGAIERRDEDIDVGMQRLADAAVDHGPDGSVAGLLASLLAKVRGEDAADDIALLGLRRLPEDDPAG